MAGARDARDGKWIGRWLKGRGRLHRPIAALSLGELECMAATAISRFAVLATERIGEHPEDSGKLATLPLDQGSVPIYGRQARGFGYTCELRFDRYPSYRFCSMRCLDAGSALVRGTAA